MKDIDTNVLLRFLLNDDPVQAAAAKAFVEAYAEAGDGLFINRTVLCETVWVLTRGYRYGKDVVAGLIGELLDAEGFTVEDRSEVVAALALWGNGIGFADALIGRTNAVRGCSTTATFDRKAARLAEFEAIA